MVLDWFKNKTSKLLGSVGKSVGNFAKNTFEKGKNVASKVGYFVDKHADTIGKIGGMALDSGMLPGGGLVKAAVKHFAKSSGNETLGKIASGLKGKKFKGVSSEPLIH
jgi:hypothetical protein